MFERAISVHTDLEGGKKKNGSRGRGEEAESNKGG